jgi:hypothetical protein
VYTLYFKRICVNREMVLMRGAYIGIMYKLFGSVDSTRCNRTVVFEIVSTMNQVDSIVSHLVDPTMLWHQSMGHIGEKGLRSLHNKCMVEGF